MTFTPVGVTVEVYNGPLCWECQGPCFTYRGSVHGWRCTACMNAYLEAAAARADEKARRHRERLTHRMFHPQAPYSLGSR